MSMKMKALFAALAVALVAALASPYTFAAGEMQIEAGSFNGAAGMTHNWDAAEFGSVSAEADKGSAAGSLAARYSFGNEGGLKFSAGVRGTSTEFTAKYGAAAQAAHEVQVGAKDEADTDIATYDANGDGKADDAANDVALADAQAASSAASAEMGRIAQVHNSNVDLTGFNATVMKEHVLTGGKRLAYGYEGFKSVEAGSKLVNAARVEYGGKQGPATWNVVANVGDGWGGMGLMVGF